MTRFLDPFRFVLIAFSGWMNGRQVLLIDYLREENRVLREQLGDKGLGFTDDQRRRLAARRKGSDARCWSNWPRSSRPRRCCLASPSDRAEVRRQQETGPWKTSEGGGDRGICRAHCEGEPHWGYRRIQGALANLGELIVAADFFTVEAWTPRGLQRFVVLFFIGLSTRKVQIAGIASVANGLLMNQIGRNATDAVDGILKGKRYLIHDRDPLFTSEFLKLVGETGVESVKLPARSPNFERLCRAIRAHDQGVVSGATDPVRRRPVRRAAAEFVMHYKYAS